MPRGHSANVFLLSAGLLAGASAALAEAPDTSSWVCEFCPFEKGYRADYEAGASYVSDDAAYFGDASGYDEEGLYADFGGSGSLITDAHQVRWLFEDAGLDSRALSLNGGNQGSYGYRLEYRQVPRHRFDTTQTVFENATADSLALPPGWTRAPATGGFTALDTSLTGRDIGSDRQTLEIGGRLFPADRWQLSADYRRQERDGLRIASGSYFTQTSLLPAPFEHSTDEAEVALRYALERGYLKLSYFGSFFRNEHAALRWQTPFTSAPGAETGVQAQAPDNTFQQLSLAGSYRLRAYDAVLAFSLAGGRIEQDDALLPYTGNASLLAGALPRQQLDGTIDTTNVALSLTARPLEKGRVSLAWRLDDRDNRTPVELWSRVIVDTFNSGESESNLPYSYRRNQLSASAQYTLLPSVIVSGGYDRVDTDRDFQAVASQAEDTGWGMLRWRPNPFIDVRARGGASERDPERYDEEFAISQGQNPLLRKYNLAYRYRRFGELILSASLPEKPVSLSVSALYADDDYTHSVLGITQGDDLRISGDISFPWGTHRYFYVHGGYESIESDQAGSEQFGMPDWTARITDSFYTAGGGIRLRQIAENLDLALDYTRAVGRTETSTNTLRDGLGWFPDLQTTLDSLRLQLTWRRSPRLAIHGALRYEAFTAEDWALEGAMPDTVPVLLSLGAQPYDYDLVLVGLGFTWYVGESAAAGEAGD